MLTPATILSNSEGGLAPLPSLFLVLGTLPGSGETNLTKAQRLPGGAQGLVGPRLGHRNVPPEQEPRETVLEVRVTERSGGGGGGLWEGASHTKARAPWLWGGHLTTKITSEDIILPAEAQFTLTYMTQRS